MRALPESTSGIEPRDRAEAPAAPRALRARALVRFAALASASSLASVLPIVIGADVEPGALARALASPYAALLASATGLAVAVAFAAGHGIGRVLPRRIARFAGPLVIALGLAPLLLPIAQELASGDGVAARIDPRAAAPLALAALEGAVIALAAWHFAVVRAALARRLRTRGPLALLALGACAAGAACTFVAGGLEAYAFLVDVLALGVVAIVGTLVFALAARGAGHSVLGAVWVAALAVALAGAMASPMALAEGRERLVSASPVAARADRIVFRAGGAGSLRIDPGTEVACEEHVDPALPEPYVLPDGPRRRNVLLLSVDALRSDAVRWTRQGRALMPNVARFIDGSARSPNAVSTYPATIFAMESAFTGLHPSRALFAPEPPVTVLARAAARADVGVAFLPRARWFRTAAVERLLVAGLRAQRSTSAATQVPSLVDALERARASEKSYVMWAHFYEPHEPYERHEGFDHGGARVDRYASELEYLDTQLGPLFEYLERSGAYEDTLVVLFADHGEALGERGYHGHHVYLDGFMTDVPLAVRAPGLAPRRIEGVVELTDVAATVAHYLGLPLDPGGSGTSLLAGDPPPDRIAISEAFPIRGNHLFALANQPVRTLETLAERMDRIHADARRYAPKVSAVSRDFRLVVDRHSGARELYRRGAPSSEQPNVAGRRPRDVARLTARLAEWHTTTARAIYCAVRDAAEAAPPMPSDTAPEASDADR